MVTCLGDSKLWLDTAGRRDPDPEAVPLPVDSWGDSVRAISTAFVPPNRVVFEVRGAVTLLLLPDILWPPLFFVAISTLLVQATESLGRFRVLGAPS